MNRLTGILSATFVLVPIVVCPASRCLAQSYAIVDTGQERCYDNLREITYPRPGEPFFGQDAQYLGHQPAYRDNGDDTITDRATGLTWMKLDSGHLAAAPHQDGRMNWEQALRWVEDLEFAGHSDWRLPNIKEFQSIVDYTRSPDTTHSAAIGPIFSVTPIRDSLGHVDYPFYWSSTTHKRMGGGESACYIAFGRSQGWMRRFGGEYELLDVHGAGSQRSDPKAGDPSQFPRGRGPQGDVIRIDNMVRPVRGGNVTFRERGRLSR